MRLSLDVALLCGSPEPFGRFGKILIHAAALLIRQTEFQLRLRMALCRRVSKPFSRGSEILLHTFAIGISHTNGVLILFIATLSVASAGLDDRFRFHLAD